MGSTNKTTAALILTAGIVTASLFLVIATVTQPAESAEPTGSDLPLATSSYSSPGAWAVEYSTVCLTRKGSAGACAYDGSPTAENVVRCQMTTAPASAAWHSCALAGLNRLGQDGWRIDLAGQDGPFVVPNRTYILTRDGLNRSP